MKRYMWETITTMEKKTMSAIRLLLLFALSSSLVAQRVWSATCSNLYCHGGQTVTWGESLSGQCNACHSSFGAGSTLGWGPSQAETIHKKHTSTDSTVGYGFACDQCHTRYGAEVISHANGPVAEVTGGKRAAEVKFYIVDEALTLHTTNYGSGATMKYYTLKRNPYTNQTITEITTATSPYTQGGSTVAADRGYFGITDVSCKNIWCHSNAQPLGGDNLYATVYSTVTVTCTSCHKGAGAGGGTNLSVAHSTHTRTTSYNYNCSYCHYETAWSSYTIKFSSHHIDGTKTVDFSTYTLTGIIYNASATYVASTYKCLDTYCHSNGLTVWLGGSPSSTVTWTSTGTVNCSSCHDSPPDYTTGKPNSHQKHKYSCQKCHYPTTNNGTTISGFAQHVTSTYTVTAGDGVSFTYNFLSKPSSSTCNDISCHGNNDATWGQTLTCYDCHISTFDVDDYVYQNGTGTIALISTDSVKGWYGTGHGRQSGNYDSGRPAANFAVAGSTQCYYCHTTDVAHNLSTNPFRLANIDNSPAQYGRNYNCLICHAWDGTGTGGKDATPGVTKSTFTAHWGTKHSTETADGNPTTDGGLYCWDCHDPHGDWNVSNSTAVTYMVQLLPAELTKGTTYYAGTSSGSYGVPYSTGSNVVIDFRRAKGGNTGAYDGPDYTDTDLTAPMTAVCQACHDSSVKYWTQTSTSSQHNPNTKCTTCHKHDNNFAGAGCNVCHGGNAPAEDNLWTSNENYWPDGVNDQDGSPDPAGQHKSHVKAVAQRNSYDLHKDTGQKSVCIFCHPGTMGEQGSRSTHNNGIANLDEFNNIIGGTDADVSVTASTSCQNSDCHARVETPGWFDVVTASCAVCHKGTNLNPQTLAHNVHTSSYPYTCTECHVNNYEVTPVSYAHTNAKVNMRFNNGSTQTIQSAWYDKSQNGAKDGNETAGADFIFDPWTPSYSACYEVYCHRPSSWTEVSWNQNLPNDSTKCGKCHQAPPTTGAGSYAHTVHNNGQVGISTTNSIGSYQYGCGICHYDTNSSSITVTKGKHAAGPADGLSYSASSQTAQISFYTTFTTSGVYKASSTVATDGRGFKYTKGRCESTYCHGPTLSTGTRQGTEPVGVTVSTPSWNVDYANATNSNGGYACGTCHNLFSSVSGSHQKHIAGGANNYAFDCGRCHNTVDYQATNYKADISSRTVHINKWFDVDFDSTTGGTYTH